MKELVMLDNSNETSPIKRKRATKAEMAERAEFVADFTRKFAPVTVRQVFYAATVNYVIEKTEGGYNKIQQVCLTGRRNGTIPYRYIADNSRSFYQVTAFEDLSNASETFADTYKRDFWASSCDAIEVWLEKEALAGVVLPVTNEYRVRLVPTRGFASETIVHSAIQTAKNEGRSRLFIKTLYDFDRSGQDAEAAIVRRMNEIGASLGVEVIHEILALTRHQIFTMDLPTRPAKKKSAADKNWKYDFAVELDAMPPEVLRSIIADALEPHMPSEYRDRYRQIEDQERATIRMALSDLT
jgi:hypothetical protein